MQKDKQYRIKKLMTVLAVVLLLGIAYYIFVKISGWAVPCVIHKLTGLYCPGCGITRMFLALVALDFETAARNNLLILLLLIPILIFAIHRARIYVKGEDPKYTTFEKISVTAVIVFALIFAVLRNLPAFSFLAPI